MNTADLMDAALRRYGVKPGARVLDFGCGAGALIAELRAKGYDASGCDIQGPWTQAATEHIGIIQLRPYRLPYADATFDAVLSTSVLEHAQNKEECFQEIRRILKPGGVSMHMLPSKWYLPTEPHIFVPFVSWLWPYVPRFWLALWAILGVRNGFQRSLGWREVLRLNSEFCKGGISYWSNSRLRELSIRVFGNYERPMRFFLRHSNGGAARLFRALPMKTLTAWLIGQTRMVFIVSRKNHAPYPRMMV